MELIPHFKFNCSEELHQQFLNYWLLEDHDWQDFVTLFRSEGFYIDQFYKDWICSDIVMAMRAISEPASEWFMLTNADTIATADSYVLKDLDEKLYSYLWLQKEQLVHYMNNTNLYDIDLKETLCEN